MIHMPAHISLKLGQIAGSPGTEHGIGSAPNQKIGKDLWEGTSALKVLLGHMYDISRHIVEFFIQDRVDRLMESPEFMKGRVQLDRADLNDLEGHLRIFLLFSIWALVPLQIHHNIIQTVPPFL